MRNLKVEELFVGAWLNDDFRCIKPVCVCGIEDNCHVSINEQVPFQGAVSRKVGNVYPLHIEEKILRGFGFIRTKGDDVWLKQIGNIRLTIGLRWRAGVQITRRCAISGRISCWNEEIRYMHELQRWWNDRVYFPYDVPLELKWEGVKDVVEELK